MPSCSFAEGAVGIFDLERFWLADVQTPLKGMHFHLTRTSLNRIAEEMDAPRIPTVRCLPYEGTIDPVLHGLALTLLPSFEHQDESNRLFIDHIRLAVGARAARVYGGMQPRTRTARGSLAPWQLRRVKDFINANLDGDFSLSDLAAECGLSTGCFFRAFRKSMGTPPHRWLLERRIAKARHLLLEGALSIAEVAVACGFVDQSHLTRVFTKSVGQPPGAWLRSRRN